MDRPFGRSLVVSGISHGIVLLAFIIVPSFFRLRKPAGQVMQLVNPSELLPPQPVTSIPVEPPPEREDVAISRTTRRTTRRTTSERPTTSAQATSSQAPTTRETTQRTTRLTTRATSRGTTSARRTTSQRRTTSRPVLDAGALRERLDRRLGGGSSAGGSAAGGGAGADGFPAWYLTSVQRQLYAAWRPPAHATRGMQCTVEIRVEKDGRISRSRLLRGSGDAAFDASSTAAVNAVGRLDPLPRSFSGRYKEISITFRLDSGA